MSKRQGQVAIFLILCLVILIGIAFIYNMGGESVSREAKTEAEKSARIALSSEGIESFLSTCLQNKAKDAIAYVSDRGGYFKLQNPYYQSPLITTAFYFYEDKSLAPNLEIIQNSISEFVLSEIPSCFQELSNLKELTNINYKINKVNAQIVKDSVIVDLQGDISYQIGDVSYRIDRLQTNIEHRLYDIHSFNTYFMDSQLENKYSICLSCIINRAANDNLFVGMETIENNNIIFTILYNNTKTNTFEKFVFANKYKEVSCNKLPLDANENLLELLTDSCLGQEIEKFNYSIKVGEKGTLNAYVGVPFTTTVLATGFNLTFVDYTNLFDIETTTGVISFTPTQDDIGLHNVLINVLDGWGNTKFTEFDINVSESR